MDHIGYAIEHGSAVPRELPIMTVASAGHPLTVDAAEASAEHHARGMGLDGLAPCQALTEVLWLILNRTAQDLSATAGGRVGHITLPDGRVMFHVGVTNPEQYAGIASREIAA